MSQEGGQEPQRGRQEGFGAPLDISEPLEAVNGALGAEEHLDASSGTDVVDGVAQMHDRVARACRTNAMGEQVWFLCIPAVEPQPDGSAAVAFYVTLSIRSAILGQRLSMTAVLEDVFADQATVDDLVRQVLEEARKARSGQQRVGALGGPGLA